VALEQIILFLDMLKISKITFLQKKNCERNCKIFWNILIFEKWNIFKVNYFIQQTCDEAGPVLWWYLI